MWIRNNCLERVGEMSSNSCCPCSGPHSQSRSCADYALYLLLCDFTRLHLRRLPHPESLVVLDRCHWYGTGRTEVIRVIRKCQTDRVSNRRRNYSVVSLVWATHLFDWIVSGFMDCTGRMSRVIETTCPVGNLNMPRRSESPHTFGSWTLTRQQGAGSLIFLIYGEFSWFDAIAR